jgi:glycosyltransferase involved in cell wall biosynthesis
MVADSPPAFAEAVAALLESPSLRAAVGENARRICADRYSWSTRDPDIARIFDLA